jgi:protein involved in polysaccharide export with SLBB domain
MIPPRFASALVIGLALSLCACDTLKKYTPSIPLPSLPDLTKVARILPGSADKVDSQDPDIDFDPRGTLRPGHTLRLQIHEGLRSAKSLWKGITVIELDGNANIGKIGSAKLRGLTLPEAATSIGAVLRVAGMTSSPVAVHILSVENVPVIAVEGDLAAGPQPLPLYDGITAADAVRLAGGRKSGSSARGVYITREGQKRYFRSIEAATNDWRLAAGDIISLSADH